MPDIYGGGDDDDDDDDDNNNNNNNNNETCLTIMAYSLNIRYISVYSKGISQYFLGENKKNHEKLNAPRSKPRTSRTRSTNAIFLLNNASRNLPALAVSKLEPYFR